MAGRERLVKPRLRKAGYTIMKSPELPHDGARFQDIEQRDRPEPDREPDPERALWLRPFAVKNEAERRLEFIIGFARAAGLGMEEARQRWAEYSADMSPARRENAELDGGEDAGWEMGDKWRKNVKQEKI